MDQRVQKVISVMEDDFSRRLSVPFLAEAVNLSSWRLCHLFKSETKMPPVRYLRTMRMEKAKGLLQSTFLSVKQIMTEVGLRDESHFVRDFRALYGLSPAKFRRQALAKEKDG